MVDWKRPQPKQVASYRLHPPYSTPDLMFAPFSGQQSSNLTVCANYMESSSPFDCSVRQLRLAVITVLLLAASLHHGETIDTAGGSNCVGTDLPLAARRSNATPGNSARVVTSTEYPSTPLPDKQRVKQAEDTNARFSKQRLTQKDIIVYYKEMAVEKTKQVAQVRQPTRAPTKNSNPAGQRECPPCSVLRSYLERQTAGCSPKRRRVEIRMGFCTKVVHTELCYGHCGTYADAYLLGSTDGVKYYGVKRTCRSCRPNRGTKFKSVWLSCPGSKRTIARIPLERSCECRPCHSV